MRSNRAFWIALQSLAHPVSLAAVVLLLINDHWLRWSTPSWLTGKLGDFTWLVFAPFIAALVLAWLVPRRLPHHERVVCFLSIGVIGLWFALAKTVSPVHQLTLDVWESIIGWQGSLRIDATDLLTLPALLLSWWIWNTVDRQAVSLRPIAYVGFALGIVTTLASDQPLYYWSDSGITRICQVGTTLITWTEAQPSASMIVDNSNVLADNPRNYQVTR